MSFAVSMALIVLLTISFSFAFAEGMPDHPSPTGVIYDNAGRDRAHSIYFGLYHKVDSSQSDALYKLKSILYKYGFFENLGMDDIDWHNDMLDDITWQAVSYCCKTNGMDEFDDRFGLTYGAFDRIMAEDIVGTHPGPTQAPLQYQEIRWNSDDQNLPAIANRLYDLGYLKNRDHSVYDQDIRNAVSQFGKDNGFPDYYASDARAPLNVHLQRTILETEIDKLVPYNDRPDPVPYWLRPVNLFGMPLPMWAVWVIGLVVVLSCVLLVIYFFFPDDSAQGPDAPTDEGNIGAKDAPKRKSGWFKSKEKNKKAPDKLHFKVEYQGRVLFDDDKPLINEFKIGRAYTTLPLDLSDNSMSRKQCNLSYENGKMVLQDHSLHGTIVNGQKVHNEKCIIKSGAKLQMGEHKITVTF